MGNIKINKKVIIKSLTNETDYDVYEKTEVIVDGKKIGEGYYGGEPEDNARYRNYSWVEPLLERLAKELGGNVKIVSGELKEDE